MPTIGPFHRNYWKARNNAVVPAGTKSTWLYPLVQTSVSTSFGFLFGALQPYWERFAAWLRPCPLDDLSADHRRAVDRVVAVMRSPYWPDAHAAVQAVAQSPKFHHQDQWVEYSRAIRANVGQAQNVFRHLKAVQMVRGLHDGDAAISNPDAHLLVELAYQAMATAPRGRLIDHPKRVIDHPKVAS